MEAREESKFPRRSSQGRTDPCSLIDLSPTRALAPREPSPDDERPISANMCLWSKTRLWKVVSHRLIVCVDPQAAPAVAATERGSHAGANHRHLASPTREEAREGAVSRGTGKGELNFHIWSKAGRRVIKFA